MFKGRSSTEELLKAQDYREFLKVLLRAGAKTPPRGALSNLARKAEISKALMTDVLNGKKCITARTMIRISTALKLQGEFNKLFQYLVAKQVDEVRVLGKITSLAALDAKLESVRIRISNKYGNDKNCGARKKPPFLLDAFTVYAALGPIDNGSDFPTIVKKTGIDPARVQLALDEMTAVGAVHNREGRFIATSRALDFEGLGQDQTFLKAFSIASAELASRTSQISQSADNLIFYSAIPIDPARANEFKERLKAAMIDLLDEFQDDSGTRIKKVVLAMH